MFGLLIAGIAIIYATNAMSGGVDSWGLRPPAGSTIESSDTVKPVDAVIEDPPDGWENERVNQRANMIRAAEGLAIRGLRPAGNR